jgi:hypothetical protein
LSKRQEETKTKMKDSFRPKTVQGVTPVHALRNREKRTGDGENARDVVYVIEKKMITSSFTWDDQ